MKPNPKKKPLPAVPQMAEPIDDETQRIMREAEEEREQAWSEDAARTWHGTLLHPWSEERARLLDALCVIDVPIPDLATCSELAFIHGMFPRAVKLLYLMHHEAHELLADRARLILLIEKWGVEHVPASTLAEKSDAVMFALKVERAHRKMQAMRRPDRRAGGGDSGN
jgi:hypothetical protein